MKNKKTNRIFIFLTIIILLGSVSNDFYSTFAKAQELSSDYSNLSWSEAFDSLFQRIVKEYAFTEWKKIDWDDLYRRYYYKIKDAQLDNNFETFYLSIRGFLNEIPDGHVAATNIWEIDQKYIGGGYGLAVAKIDSGEIVVVWVDNKSNAWIEGIRPGTVIVEWNGEKTADALQNVSTLLTNNSATDENLEIKKLQFLVRAPIGEKTLVTFSNGEDAKPQTVLLTSYDDQRISLKKIYPDSVVSDGIRHAINNEFNPDPLPNLMVQDSILEKNISYIKIWGEIDADLTQTGQPLSTLQLFRQAIDRAINVNSKGIIIDLRNNIGGLDQMAADILGTFYNKKTFYEYQYAYDPVTGERSIISTDPLNSDSRELYIIPADHFFDKKVIALINTKCISSGEGIALGINNLPNGETLGFYGTNGSFGLSGSEAVMPGGIIVHWPSGQSLDENKRIQLDSRNGYGGVSPTIRIPMTKVNAIRLAKGEDIELEEALEILNRN